MINSSSIKTGEILPEFQKSLAEKKLVPAVDFKNYISHLALKEKVANGKGKPA